MGKKGRQGVSRKQPNPRKIQKNEAALEEKTAATNARPKGVAENLPQKNIAESAVDHNLGQVLGLQNLGHTCFFNAAVQVLLASELVVKTFLPESQRGPLGNGLHEVVAQANSQDAAFQAAEKSNTRSKAFAPRRLHSAIVKMAPHFKAGVQQDSHELLRLLLDGLHNEEAKSKAKDRQKSADQKEELMETFPSKLFGARLISKLECMDCSHTVTHEEEFLDISVEVPQTGSSKSHSSIDFLQKGGQQGKKGKKKLFEVPLSSDLDTKDKKLSLKQRKQVNKLAKKEATLARKKDRKRSAAVSLQKEPSEADALQDIPGSGTPSPSLQDKGTPDKSGEAFPPAANTNSAASNPTSIPEQSSSTVDNASPQSGLNGAAGFELNGTADSEDDISSGERSNTMLQKGEGVATAEEQSATAGGTVSSMNQEQAQPNNQSDMGEGNEDAEADRETSQASGIEQDIGELNQIEEAEGSSEVGDGDKVADSIEGTFTKLWKEGNEENRHKEDTHLSDATASLPASSPEAHMEGDAKNDASSEEATLASCLASFFTPEVVEWECPSQKEQEKEDADSFQTPLREALALSSRNVSFSEERPKIRLIPGSIEQRGTDVKKALQGDVPFCRPLKFLSEDEEVYLLVTALVDRTEGTVSLGLQPQNESIATMSVLEDPMGGIANPAVNFGEDLGDEEEQERVAQEVQLLMDCVADMVVHEGVQNMGQMTQAGMTLFPESRPRFVRGQFPDHMGGGSWEYPLEDPGSGDLLKRESYLSCSSPASSTMARAPSQTLEEPSTPAAASVTSFESIDLDSSPVRKPSRLGGALFSPAVSPIWEAGEAMGVSSKTPSVEGAEAVEDTAASPQIDTLLTNPGIQSLETPKPGKSSPEPHQKLQHEEEPDSLQSPLPERLQNLKISSNSQDNGREDANASSASEGEAAALTSKLQGLKGGLKGKSTVKQQKAQHKARKGYLIKGAPRLLLIHLKRFQIDARGTVRKIQGCVPFSTELDLKPFCVPEGLIDSGSTEYDLVGVVEHLGSSMRSGHYHAYTRGTAKADPGSDETLEAPAKPQEQNSTIEPQHSRYSADESKIATESGETSTANRLDGEAREHAPKAADTSNQDQAVELIRAADEHKGGHDSIQSHSEDISGDRSSHEKNVEGQTPKVAKGKHGPGSESAPNAAEERTGTWYKISDHHYSRVSLQEVLASEAYVLLYTRRS